MLRALPVDPRDDEIDALWAVARSTDNSLRQSGPRYADTSVSWGTRALGAGGAAILVLVVMLGAVFTWHVHSAPKEPAAMHVFDVAPPAVPAEPVHDTPAGPETTEHEERPVVREQPMTPSPAVALPDIVGLSRAAPVPDPAPAVAETTAPESKPPPPEPTGSADQSSWEGAVLAALNAVKRYPRAAMARRQQGVPFIRFVLDRRGRVVSARLERSSGFAALDDEAASLPERAQPLPKPPDHVKGDRIEMIVPVEFIMR